jgi:hypothetical protein
MRRREFVGGMLLGGVAGAAADAQVRAADVEERMTWPTGAGWDSPVGTNADEIRWVQVDLGSPQRIDAVKLYPKFNPSPLVGRGFPVRFRIEASGGAAFQGAAAIADHTGGDFVDPANRIETFVANGVTARYVRVTATRLREVSGGRQEQQKRYGFSLSKLDVISAGSNIAEGRPVSDSVKGDLGITALTRPARPQGEVIVTDNAGNVTEPRDWKPPVHRVAVPRGGVRLTGGILKTAFENNIGYLLSSFSVDELLKEFRDRAGKPSPPGLPPPERFWQTDLAGSNAGRFLMGAGNSLRWTEHPELRRRMEQVVAGIAECRQPDGYIMAYPEDTIFYSERGAYTRAWLTHGLIEAGYAGSAAAFRLLRGYYDWFDRCEYLPRLLRGAIQGGQGMIANTRMYSTPVGKPADIQVIQQYFQENYWLAALAKRDEAAVWLYPYDRPHCYLITDLEAYMDLYLATGELRYLDAAKGGWDLYHDKWEHTGGTIAICENGIYPPSSYRLHAKTGELCGNSFWSFYSQRFHLLWPGEEKYVAEIEKSIYNVALANQVGTEGIRYTASLVGRKDFGRNPANSSARPSIRSNTCCEGQGTRLLGAMPEFIYSVAQDGLYVNLFAASEIEWKHRGQMVKVEMATEFPYRPDVELRISTRRPIRLVLHLREPSWVADPIDIRVNGKTHTGLKACATLDREWRDGDTISLTLPMGFRLSAYTGQERVPGQEQFALEYGPILMALVGDVDEKSGARLFMTEADLPKRLRPKPGAPLHFTIAGDPAHEYMPYFEISGQVFTCYPVMAYA